MSPIFISTYYRFKLFITSGMAISEDSHQVLRGFKLCLLQSLLSIIEYESLLANDGNPSESIGLTLDDSAPLISKKNFA